MTIFATVKEQHKRLNLKKTWWYDTIGHAFLSSFIVNRQKQRNVFFGCPGLKGLDTPENGAFLSVNLKEKHGGSCRFAMLPRNDTQNDTVCYAFPSSFIVYRQKQGNVFFWMPSIHKVSFFPWTIIPFSRIVARISNFDYFPHS